MKVIIFLAVIAVASAAGIKDVIEEAIEEVIEYYTTLNDYLDIDAVIDNDEEFQSYIDCFKDVKPCTDLANSYKVHIPESIQQACRRCNSAQKHLAKRFFEALKEKRPEEYEHFKKTFDPQNKYFNAFEKAVANY